MVGVGRHDDLRAFCDRFKAGPEERKKTFVKPQILNGGGDLAVFDPKTGVSGHSREAGVQAIAPVEVMEIAHIEAGSKPLQNVGGR